MKIRFKRVQLRVILEYIAAIALTLECRSIWLYLYPQKSWTRTALLVISLGAFILLCLLYRRRKNTASTVLGLIFIDGIFIIQALLLNVNIQYHFELILMFTIIYLYITSCCDYDELPGVLKAYRNIIFSLAVISLILWLAISVLGIMNTNQYVYTMWTSSGHPDRIRTFHNIYYEIQKNSFLSLLFPHSKVYRNTSIFTEAPMATVHFCLAFLMEVFSPREKSNKRIMILALAVASTASTTGYIVVITTLFGLWVSNGRSKRIAKAVKFMMVPGVLLAVGFVVVHMIADKLMTGSGVVRVDDFKAGFLAWLDAPLLGNGINNIDCLRKYMSSFRSNNSGFSNSIMMVFAQGGIVLGFFYVFPFTKCVITQMKCHSRKNAILAVEIAFMLFLSVVAYQYLTIFVLVWLYFLSGKKHTVMSQTSRNDFL
ncbi:MAG: hypothetical protein ACOX68_06575 [Candidatus Limivicinus sp.]|jgi:hypothetical protein